MVKAIQQKREQDFPSNKIIKKVWIRASADAVYSALTESKELAHWFCDRASIDLREGGELTAIWKAGKESREGKAQITRLIQGFAIDLLWREDSQNSGGQCARHTLHYEIKTKSGMTELIVTDNDEATSDEEEIAFIAQGWNSVLMELKEHCERKERLAKLQTKPQKNPA
jgi:uncharacterized protein YndB with AHSA1/START domain